MGLFNLFRPAEKNGIDIQNTLGPTHGDQNLPEIPEKVFIDKEPPPNIAQETTSPAKVENNIDLLFNFLDRNHEEAGYNDALRNPDSSHRDQNIEALRNELSRTIRKVNTYYEDFVREINFHIDSRGRNGMVDTVEELKMKREIAESHLKKVKDIETDAKNKTGDSEGIIISYRRGFENGLAAITHHNILKRNI